MSKKCTFLISCLWLFLNSLQAQCPAEKYLLNRIIYFNNHPNLPSKEILGELETFLANINDCPYKNDSTHVFLLRRIALEYSRTGDHLKGIAYVEEALRIMNSNIGKPSINPEDLVTLYYFLSTFYDSLNYAKAELAAIDSGINIGMRLKNFSSFAFIQLLAKKVQYYYDIGDYHRCVQDAILCEKLSADYINSTDKAYRNFGVYLNSHSLGWHVKALLELNEYEEAEKLIANKLDQYRRAGLVDYIGLIYAQKADIEEDKGNYQNALLCFNKSLSYDQKTGDYFNCKQTLKNIGFEIYFEHLHDWDEALVYYRKALSYTGMDKSEKIKDANESLDLYADIANVYVQKGLYDSAFFYFQLAFDQIKPGTNETNILRFPSERFIEMKKIHYLTNLMIGKGDAYLRKYLKTKNDNDLANSILVYKVTDSLLDRIKVEQIEMESKLFWRKNYRRMYEHAINACYLSGDRENTFYFFEKSRASILNDLLTEQRWETDKDISELSQARKKVSALEREIKNFGSSSGTSSDLQKNILEKRNELDQIQETVKRKNPFYYQNILDPNHIVLKDVYERILNDHQSFLELFEGDSAVYTLFITNAHIHFNKINKTDFDNCSGLFNSLLANEDSLNRNFFEFSNTAYHLYKLIFNVNVVPPGRIIISPGGVYFPFEALVTDNTNPRSPVYFLEDHVVSYTYSARYLMNSFSHPENNGSGSVLGIAPVHYTYNSSLNSLEGSDRSLDNVRSNFKKSGVLEGSGATRNNFLQQYSKYYIIQLYTHSSDSSDRNEPVIYFSDSSLYLSELIQETKPSAQLIVLSACNTGSGKFYQGEGVFSFNRAFASVGIPASVINLWSIDSKSTYRLTELFYKYLADGTTTDQALQSAKLEFIHSSGRRQSLPYFWAAPILIGKSEAIDFHQRISLIAWLIPFFIISFSLLIWMIWKKRKFNFPAGNRHH